MWDCLSTLLPDHLAVNQVFPLTLRDSGELNIPPTLCLAGRGDQEMKLEDYSRNFLLEGSSTTQIHVL